MIPQEELDAMLGETLGVASPLSQAVDLRSASESLTLSDDDDLKMDRSPSVWARETLDELASELRKDTEEVRDVPLRTHTFTRNTHTHSPAHKSTYTHTRTHLC